VSIPALLIEVPASAKLQALALPDFLVSPPSGQQ
jgi:hypothetical protein